ncbi:MAG: stage II sporulation protein M [Vicinamibacteria bacterium]
MDYGRFVRTRQPVWDEFERRLRAAQDGTALDHEELEALAFRYRQVLHDHALAAARYPDTGSARRLWALALAGTQWLQRDRGRRLPGPWAFYARVFPAAFRRIAGSIGLAAALFASSAVIGLSMAIVQPGMGAVFLGPDAMAGLREGRMWTDALTSTVPPAVSSSAIATNNMGVAIMAWAGGALAGLGALWVVLMNGFMLGVVIGATLPFDMTGRLLTFVAAHGPLEITLILVSAGAGLDMGRALVVSGDRPRSETARESALRALVVLGGCLPFFLLLGFVEGFVSPAADVATPVKIALGAALWVAFALLAWNPLAAGE